jgi:hypothetical protein
MYFDVLYKRLVIFNIQGQLDEDKLQFLEYFTDFATRFFKEDIEYSGKLFQNFVFLMRDWPADHAYGLHDQNSPKTKNFMKELISGEDFSEEAMATRQQILDYFNHVSCFLLPSPGPGITENIDGNIANMDRKFTQYLQEFVTSVLGKDKTKPKIIYGDLMTGKKLKDVVDKWANLISREDFPEPKSLSEATAEAHLEMASRRSEKRHETRILGLAKCGMEDSLFESKHLEFTQEVMDQFKETASRFRKYEERHEYTKKLEKRINNSFLIYSEINQATRREAEYKEGYEQLKDERANINRHLTRQQTLIEHQQQKLQQQKDITDDEKRKKEEEIEKMEKNMNILKMKKKELKKKIKDQNKMIKLEKKRKELALEARIQIFKPIGELLDTTVNRLFSLLSPSMYRMDSSSQLDAKGDVVDDNDEDDDDDDDDYDDDDSNEKDRRDPCSADTTQENVLKSALLAGLGTVASGDSPKAAILSGLGNLLLGASSASNQIAEFKNNAEKQ